MAGIGAGAGIAEGLAPINDLLFRMVGAKYQAKEIAKNKAGMQVLKSAMTENPEIIGTPEFEKSMKSLLGGDTWKELQPTLQAFAENPAVQAKQITKTALFGGVDVENPEAITSALKGLGITSTGGMMARAPEAAQATASAPTTKVPLKNLQPEVAADVLRKRFATESGPMVSLATGDNAIGGQAQAERKMVTGAERFDKKLALDVYKTNQRKVLADKKLALSERRLGVAEENLAIAQMKANRSRIKPMTVKDGENEKLVFLEFGPDGKLVSETTKYTAPRQLPRLKSPMPVTTQTLALSRALQSRGYTEDQARDLIESRSIPKWAIEKATKSLKNDTKAWKDRVARQYDNVVKRRLGKTPQFPDDPALSEWDEGALQKVAQGSVSDLAALLNFAMMGAASVPPAEAAPTVNPPITGPMKLPGGATFIPR